MVEDRHYGLGSASGDGCNCLIDSSRQALPGVICSVPLVRTLLEERHRGRDTRITRGDVLDLERWEDIVNLLGERNENRVHEHNAVRRVDAWASRFQVICVDLTWIGNGEVFPRGVREGRTMLHLARVNQNHFIPLIRLHGPPPSRAPAPSLPSGSSASR